MLYFSLERHLPMPLFRTILKELKFSIQAEAEFITEIIRISPVIIYFFPGIFFPFPMTFISTIDFLPPLCDIALSLPLP